MIWSKFYMSSSRKNFLYVEFCMNGSIEGRCTNYKNSSVCNSDFIIEGRCTNYKNSSVCNSDFISRSVLLEFFKVPYLPCICPLSYLPSIVFALYRICPLSYLPSIDHAFEFFRIFS